MLNKIIKMKTKTNFGRADHTIFPTCCLESFCSAALWVSFLTEISENIVHVVILDISGVYAQIHNQGYFDKSSIDDIRQQYSNTEHWRVVVLDE